MINCKCCGKEIAKNANICPNCGAKNKKPFYKRVWFWVIIFFILGAAAASGDYENDSEAIENTSEKKVERFSYTITDEYSDSFSHYIEGTVKNNRNKNYSYVQIEFICYDKDGNNLGIAIDNTNNLLGNQTWKFKAFSIFTDNLVDHCDFHEITGW